jgi:hypothetical protein
MYREGGRYMESADKNKEKKEDTKKRGRKGKEKEKIHIQ